MECEQLSGDFHSRPEDLCRWEHRTVAVGGTGPGARPAEKLPALPRDFHAALKSLALAGLTPTGQFQGLRVS